MTGKHVWAVNAFLLSLAVLAAIFQCCSQGHSCHGQEHEFDVTRIRPRLGELPHLGKT